MKCLGIPIIDFSKRGKLYAWVQAVAAAYPIGLEHTITTLLYPVLNIVAFRQPNIIVFSWC